MKPTKIEFQIGKDLHGRQVRLICPNENGRQGWSIRREAGNQLDEPAEVTSLPGEVVVAMAEAVRSVESHPKRVSPEVGPSMRTN